MTARLVRIGLALYLISALVVGSPAFAQSPGAAPQQSSSSQASATSANQGAVTPYTSLLFRRDYSKGKHAFPNIFAPYTSQRITQPILTNAPTIYSLVQDGKLNLSLPDAIALALENNLDIGVAEYTPWIDETQILNAQGGGVPLGQFVIGGGGGGSFDPVINVNSSINSTSQTVNNPLTSGVGTNSAALTQASHDTRINVSYTQELHSGTVFTAELDNNRSSSSPSANFFNPAITSDLFVGIQQPLLNGWGFLPHTRFILEAKNNTKIGQLQFKEQVINSVTQVEIQYWNLVFDEQAVEVANQSLAAYQKLYEADQHLLQIGEISPSDEVLAESFIAQANQILLGAQEAVGVQDAVVMGLITKDPSDPRVKGVEIVPTTPLANSPDVPPITLDDAIKEAVANRPEVQVYSYTLQNDHYNVRATKNSLLPILTVGGEYISFGLSGNTLGRFTPNGTFAPDLGEPIVDQNGNAVTSNGVPIFIGVPNGALGPGAASGIGNAYSQIFHNRSPEYSASLNLTLPLRNRSAQAANAQDQLIERQDKVASQRQKSTVITNVKEALAAISLYAAQVDAAVKATQLYQQSYDYEVKKFTLGQSGAQGTYFVTQQASFLNNAKLSELQAKANYEIALANFNAALGRTLTSNNITISGTRNQPVDFNARAPLIPGTIDGRLAGEDVFGLDLHK